MLSLAEIPIHTSIGGGVGVGVQGGWEGGGGGVRDVRGYRSLQQQELVNPPLECCEMVIWWKTFISEGVPKCCCARKKA